MTFRRMVCVLALSAAAPVAVAHADVAPPALGAGCSAELADAMTLLPDLTTYAVCQQAGLGYSWAAPEDMPFGPSERWFSYGPAITLHGQAMRNPNLSSGQWTAIPRDPEATCRAKETTVVEAGVLAEPRVFEGDQGAPLELQMLPRLFYAELSGDCLWMKS